MPKKSDILKELKDLNVSFPHVSLPLSAVPDGYFEALGENIQATIVLDSFLSNLPKETPFLLENTYFDTFNAHLLENIQVNEFLSNLPKQTPFEVSANYFDELSTEITLQSQTSNFIATLPNQNYYEIPPQYFEKLSDEIIAKNNKINDINPLRITRIFYSKLAIAASLFVMLSIGFLFMIQNSNTVSFEKQIAQVSDADINDYIQNHAYEFDNELSFQMMDESKIDLNKLENDVYNSYFDNISDEEINNFL